MTPSDYLILTFMLYLLVSWAALLTKVQRGLSRILPAPAPAEGESPQVNEDFALLVPFARAQDGLKGLLQSLVEQKISWSSGRVLLIADHPPENDLAQVKESIAHYKKLLPLQLAVNPGIAGKKSALAYGRAQVQVKIIVQSDADVVWEADALAALLQPFAQKDQALVMGYVKMTSENRAVGALAAIDFLSLQAVGHGLAAMQQPLMANGACMAYRSALYDRFQEVGRSFSSGDDVFLLQAIAKAKAGRISSQLAARVSTPAPQSLPAFLRQRVRWGAKSTGYPSVRAKYLAILTASYNATILLLLLAGLLEARYWLMAALIWLPKVWMDGQLLYAFSRDMKEDWSWRNYFGNALVYPFYISLTVLMILFGPASRRKW